jgi:hypothetical protein
MDFIFTSKKEIENWLNEVNIHNYTIHDDLTVDVKNTLYLQTFNLKTLPIQFNQIDGSFYCSDTNLISIKGFPKVIKGDCYCMEKLIYII